jgi:GntR family transcriptional repressor for pyruvate dehydrogenase complex
MWIRARSLGHLKLRLDLAAETREKLGQFLPVGVFRKIGENFDAGHLVSKVDELHGSQIRVLQRVPLTLRRSDRHAKRGAVTLPRHDDGGEATHPGRDLLDRGTDGSGGPGGHELKKLFTHENLWYTGSVIEPVDNQTLSPRQDGVKRFTRAAGEDSPLIAPIKKTRVAEEVADRIRALMLDGTFPADQPLPSERHLAEHFGVSRGSIRDALRTLETIGLLETRHGQGTFPRELSVERLVAPLASVMAYRADLQDELLDMRRIFEPVVARVAATRATEEDLADLQRVLETQKQKLKTGQSAITEDTAFHAILARATRNRVVMSVMATLNDLLVESRTHSLQQRGRPARSVDGHEAVVAALRR